MFGLLKKLFSKPITTDESDSNELVDMCYLKNNELKLNSELMVENNYYCIIMHYDDMCDILASGKYKANDRDLPRLMRYAKTIKTKKGPIAPKSVPADIYFVNMNPIKDNCFKSPYKVVLLDGDKKVKTRVYGSYTIKADSPTKLIAALKSDYDCIRKGVAIKELSAIIGYIIGEIAYKEKLKLKDLQEPTQDIIDLLTERLNKKLDQYGCILSDLKISKVVLPKNYVEKQFEIEDAKPKTKQKHIPEEIEEEPVPVMARGEQEATVNTDNVINLGYGDMQPEPATKQSAQEIYEAYSKQFASNNVTTTSDQAAPNILSGVAKEPAEERVQTLEPTPPAPNDDKDVINLLGGHAIASQQEVASRKQEINDIKSFVLGETKKEEPKTQEKQPEKPVVPQEDKPKPQEKPKTIKTCPVCAQTMALDARFCSNCGANVSEEIICKACGTKNQGDAKFCKICGSKLN